MMLFLRVLLGLGIAGWISKSLSDDGSIRITNKSNCHDDFLAFDKNLNIPKSKLSKLKKAQVSIQKILKEYFKAQKNFPIPQFAMQGSFKCGTMVRTVKDSCDFDMGVYFFVEPKQTYGTIQKHIYKALYGHTTAGLQLKSKCVRLNYQGDFHVDMPIYFSSDKQNYYLGSKGNNWGVCDSKYFKDWVLDNTKDSPQTIRIIKYFKAWADLCLYKKRIKMPSGLVFTIWSIELYKPHKRDDVSLIYTAAEILKQLKDNFKSDWKCKMPVEPYDNVLDKLTKEQKTNFFSALEELVKDGLNAITSENKEQTKAIWEELLGKRFIKYLNYG